MLNYCFEFLSFILKLKPNINELPQKSPNSDKCRDEILKVYIHSLTFHRTIFKKAKKYLPKNSFKIQKNPFENNM